MKRPLYLLPALAIMLTGCEAELATDSPSTTPPAAESPVASEPADVLANATCNGLSFFLDPALASGYVCETVPASTDELEPYPQHTRVTLQGYPLTGTFFEARIDVYPVADYAALAPSVFSWLETDLQALTSGNEDPVFVESFGPGLPFLPVFNAAQAFFAQYGVLSFASGTGIRFLTEISQYAVPVNNTDLFYTYQGLTNDGQYWVSAILPINLAALPVSADDAMAGQTFEEWATGYEPYIVTSVGQLDSAAPTDFSPTIDTLDALVASIAIEPEG